MGHAVVRNLGAAAFVATAAVSIGPTCVGCFSKASFRRDDQEVGDVNLLRAAKKCRLGTLSRVETQFFYAAHSESLWKGCQLGILD